MPIMQTFTSREAQTRWGTVTDIAKKEPVTVTQYGRPSFMLLPIEIGQEALRLNIARQRAHEIQSELDEKPLPSRRSLGMLKFLQEARATTRTRTEIDQALNADRASWNT
jgi:antitoxin (DNA-binding transcriptional repressor) of toxin-antitoxin stability system